MVGNRTITILKELRDFIVPLSAEEFNILEQSIKAEGCRDALIVWHKSDNKLVLLDGHNRYKICQKLGITFKIKKLEFKGLEEAKRWMVDNQLGRRNLNPDQLSYYRGVKYLSLKKNKGGYNNVLLKGQSDLSTTEILAGQFQVSESTIKRDAKFAQGLNIIGMSNSKLKMKILSGLSKVKKSEIQLLSEYSNASQLKIHNEADLRIKAQKIREQILDEVERKVKSVHNYEFDDDQPTFSDDKPVFLDKDDRLRHIKGMIVSAINRAINKKDINAIKELKKLIDRLQDELF